MKKGIYVGYSRVPKEVYILRSTEKRHLIVHKQPWENREGMYERSIRYFEEKLERFPSQFHQERLAKLMGYGTADAWVEKWHGMWVTHGRVFNIEEVGEQ